MSVIDKNKIFFGLIHYILSEQKNVDWILKTSLIDFTGISSILEEKPYKKESLINDVVDYVTSIKPYHVQFSHYFEHYETASELIQIPKNDKVETTIHKRFDSIQSKPDIIKFLYSIEDELPEGDEYNTLGIEIFVKSNNSFYKRVFKNSEYSWEYESDLVHDGIYHISKTDRYYTGKNNNLTTDFDKNAFINSHLANRLFYLGLHDLDELKKELHANFKGLEINGHTFNIGDFGYELFDYETHDYDSPTVVYDYCFIDNKEDFESFDKDVNFTYDKIIVPSGEHRFNLPSINTVGKIVKIYIQKDGNKPVQTEDYELKLNQEFGDYLEIYNGLLKNDKAIIGIFNQYKSNEGDDILKLSSAFVIMGYPFIESSSNILKREFKFLNGGDIILKTAVSDSASDKIVIQKQGLDGGKKIFLNYKTSNSDIIINSLDIKSGEHILITSFDYKYLYDKIYMWEDIYGRSNNIINLDGNNFLRAIYESDRPRELVVSHPLNSFTIYEYNDNNECIIYNNNYKNDFLTCNYNISNSTEITNLTYSNDSKSIINEIVVKNSGILEDAPGKIIINSEIIEYNSIDKKTNTLSKLKRGINGSVLYIDVLSPNNKKTHSIGDIVRPYIDDLWIENDKDYSYITYTITDPFKTIYDCPTGLRENSFVSVKVLNKINLLNTITEKSDRITIDSCNIVDLNTQDILKYETTTTKYHGNFSLKLNNDTIPFTTIYKDDIEENMYHIEDFILPEKYKNYGDNIIYEPSSSFIHSSIPHDFENYEVSIISSGVEFTLETTETGETYAYDMFGTPMYRFAGNIVYDSSDTDIGTIINSIIYKNDRTLYAKIIDDKMIEVKAVISLTTGLDKGSALQIKVENTNPNE